LAEYLADADGLASAGRAACQLAEDQFNFDKLADKLEGVLLMALEDA
jgi:hypothetical protein